MDGNVRPWEFSFLIEATLYAGGNAPIGREILTI